MASSCEGTELGFFESAGHSTKGKIITERRQ